MGLKIFNGVEWVSTGSPGIQGVTGISGVGVTGLQGTTGTRGETGLPGLGYTGFQGATGSQGETGISGNIAGQISVKEFGAVGDGVTNDTAAINLAINDANNRYIVFPPGVYLVTGQLLASTSYTTLYFLPGAIIRKGTTNIDCLQINANFVTVFGAEFDGASMSGTNGHGVKVWGTNNIIDSCYIHDNTRNGIYLDGQATTTTECIVCRNTITNNGEVGVAQNLAYECKITDNHISLCGYEGITCDNQAHRSIVMGNKLDTCCQTGGVAAIGIDFSDLCIISNNDINGCSLPGIKTQNNLGSTNYNIFCNNTIVDCTTYGIHLYNNASATSSYWMISGNLVRNSGTPLIIDSGCNNNMCVHNQWCGVAVSDSGSGNTV